jgi:hypothetical protein
VQSWFSPTIQAASGKVWHRCWNTVPLSISTNVCTVAGGDAGNESDIDLMVIADNGLHRRDNYPDTGGRNEVSPFSREGHSFLGDFQTARKAV